MGSGEHGSGGEERERPEDVGGGGNAFRISSFLS